MMILKHKLFSHILIPVVIIVSSNIASGAIDQAKIVGLWLFDESGGDITRDSSGNGHDGKITGAQRVAGKFGNALEFKGKDFVTVPDAQDLRVGEKFTMQAWFFARDIGNWRQIIAKDNEYLLRIDPPQEGNKMSAFIKVNNAWEPRVSAAVPELETWIHIAATYDSDQVKLYIDGAMSGNGSRPGKVSPTKNPVEFGRWGGGLIGDDVGYFIGIIDEIAIFNTTLTEKDIKETMNGLQKFSMSVEASGKLAVAWGKIKSISNISN